MKEATWSGYGISLGSLLAAIIAVGMIQLPGIAEVSVNHDPDEGKTTVELMPEEASADPPALYLRYTVEGNMPSHEELERETVTFGFLLPLGAFIRLGQEGGCVPDVVQTLVNRQRAEGNENRRTPFASFRVLGMDTYDPRWQGEATLMYNIYPAQWVIQMAEPEAVVEYRICGRMNETLTLEQREQIQQFVNRIERLDSEF